ncbi:hypothetical protein [Pseudoxanthobacter sp.]|uniref:hypothetical protein n=1 Tax=Pseudoxanthobacter sp. TaxID=1925742 RepID=UPI002FE2E54B
MASLISIESLFVKVLFFTAISFIIKIILEPIFCHSEKESCCIYGINLGFFESINSNLTAYIALLASITACFVTYDQIKSKIRADSRQKWINKVRIIIAKLISQYKYIVETSPSIPDDKYINDLNLLKLYLNPSELDHRLILRIFCFAAGENSYYIEKELDEIPEIKQLTDSKSTVYRNKNLIPILEIVSAALLKREWERVRGAQ